MTDAEKFAADHNASPTSMLNALDPATGADGISIDQLWDDGCTVLTFDDGSQIRYSGPEFYILND